VARWASTEGAILSAGPGAAWVEEDHAYNFSLYARDAESVVLLLFAEDNPAHPLLEYRFDPRVNKTWNVWHCRLPVRVAGGARYYAYRIDGPRAGGPGSWHAYDPEKVLLDPHAKEVFFPPGFDREAARRPGSRVMDPYDFEPNHPDSDRRFGFRRPTNNAGGIEGGTSNGEPIVVRAAKKPISTLAARGPSINMATKLPQPAAYERSDVCAVPAASVIVENVVAFEIAAAIVEKYVGTSLLAIQTAMAALHHLNQQRLAHWGDDPLSPRATHKL